MNRHSLSQRSTKGQGITEYGFILAFVALLIATVFGFGQGHLATGLSTSHSNVTGNIGRIVNASHRAN